jgi:hypothetical protein
MGVLWLATALLKGKNYRIRSGLMINIGMFFRNPDSKYSNVLDSNALAFLKSYPEQLLSTN